MIRRNKALGAFSLDRVALGGGKEPAARIKIKADYLWATTPGGKHVFDLPKARSAERVFSYVANSLDRPDSRSGVGRRQTKAAIRRFRTDLRDTKRPHSEVAMVNKNSNRGRPPVLAHERFVQHRDLLVGLDLPGRFSRIFEMNLWGAATSVSGLGSEEGATARLCRKIGPTLRSLGVKRLLDAPCGDAGWIARADLEAVSYVGVDIVQELIDFLRRERAGVGEFLVADITHDALPSADAILCRDCLVHLSFDNIARVLKRFKATGAQWLITTTFPEWKHNADCEDGDWRALNFEQQPFYWSAPEHLLVEGCDEASGGWQDKSLGFWRLDRLPTMVAVAGSTEPFTA